MSAADGRPILTYSGGVAKPEYVSRRLRFTKHSVDLANAMHDKLNNAPPSNKYGHPIENDGIKNVFVDATFMSFSVWGNGAFDCACCGGTEHCLPGRCGERNVFVAFMRSGIVTFEIHSIVMCDNAAAMLQKPSDMSAADTIKMWCDINRNTYITNKPIIDNIHEALKAWKYINPAVVSAQQIKAQQTIDEHPEYHTICHKITNGIVVILGWEISRAIKWRVIDFIIDETVVESIEEPIESNPKKFSDEVLMKIVVSINNESENAWTSV